jgi:hypothetical protein
VKGLQRLQGINHERDFPFVVGDERHFSPSFLAEFLSPRVSSLRSQDVTIDELTIRTADPNHSFAVLLSIGFGREISLSDLGLPFVRSVCGELWNSELFEQTFKHEDGQMSASELKARLDFISGVDGSCDCGIPVIASHFYEFSTSDFDDLRPAALEAILNHQSLVVQDEDSVFDVVHRLACKDSAYFGLLEFVRFEFLSDECMSTAFEFISSSFESFTFAIWSSFRSRLLLPATPPSQTGRFRPLHAIESKIISATPQIFSILSGRAFRLLYRGSRDSFEASAFHGRCNGHPNTVTLISTTNDCIFGGYTPVAWSSEGGHASDMSMESFIFTIKNPHNLPARIFKQKQGILAAYHISSYGPTFGNGCDFYVCDRCRDSNSSYSNFGSTYTNDTGIAGKEVLTGAYNFTVVEIEVFEVTWRQ